MGGLRNVSRHRTKLKIKVPFDKRIIVPAKNELTASPICAPFNPRGLLPKSQIIFNFIFKQGAIFEELSHLLVAPLLESLSALCDSKFQSLVIPWTIYFQL